MTDKVQAVPDFVHLTESDRQLSRENASRIGLIGLKGYQPVVGMFGTIAGTLSESDRPLPIVQDMWEMQKTIAAARRLSYALPVTPQSTRRPAYAGLHR